MNVTAEKLAYSDTGYFSKLVLDYLDQKETIQSFYAHTPDFNGIEAAIEARKQFDQQRDLLADVLEAQYKNIELSAPVKANINLLRKDSTFTITTAHQPNILTGPLYFIYKILHAIKLAATLEDKFPDYDFVPVYYMGSEDADLDELGHIFLNGEKVSWQTDQVGAVGRMHPKGIEAIINRLEGEFGGEPFGAEMIRICRAAYLHANIQEATLYLVNELFKDYGLVVLIPDSSKLKKTFHEVVKRELLSQFSYPLVQQTSGAIGEHYKVQTSGRELNLFYLDDNGSRERIEYFKVPEVAGEMILPDAGEEKFLIVNTDKTFTKEAMLEELENHPERFSGNVILRGVFQETVLPNIVFIGGGGELGYWMELKKVFEAVDVPYPVLLLRNSLLLVFQKQAELQAKLGIATNELFLPTDALKKEVIVKHTHNRLHTKPEQDAVYNLYEQLQQLASAVDPTLKAHVAALHTATLKGLLTLEKKLVRAEKRNHSELMTHLDKLKKMLFPNNNLQERVDNFMPLFARYGFALLNILYDNSKALPSQFTILHFKEN